ncbi:hypothetical protein AADZ86_01230 [Colwelliaceae bacterium BS250]
MITLTTIKMYRAVATAMVLMPIFLMNQFEQTILASLIYIPMLTLTLASLGKYVDLYLVKAMRLPQSTDKLNNDLKIVTKKDEISCCKMAA